MIHAMPRLVLVRRAVFCLAVLLPVCARAELPAFDGVKDAGPVAADWEERTIAFWLLGLRELRSTREHAEYLERRPLPVRLVGSDKLRAAFAARLPGEIWVNWHELSRMRKKLLEQGVAPAEVDEFMAMKTLPAVVHELRHAMTAEQVLRSAGAPFDFPLVEDELLSYADQARVLEELRQTHPRVAGAVTETSDETVQQGLMEAWPKGLASMRDFVRDAYPAVPSVLESSDEDLGSYYGKEARRYAAKLDEIARLKARVVAAASERERFNLERDLARLGPEEEWREYRDNSEEARRYFSDPRRTAGMRDYYDGKLRPQH